MVPHFLNPTQPQQPINELEQRILDAQPMIERWFRLEWMEHRPMTYTCIGLRNAGFKLSAVDVHLHPHSWANLTPEMLPLATQAATLWVERNCPIAKDLLLVMDDRVLVGPNADTFYLQSLVVLRGILQHAGLNVRIASVAPQLQHNMDIVLPNGATLCIEPAQRVGNVLTVPNFTPCIVLLNHALEHGILGIFEELKGQCILPAMQASSCLRNKRHHLQSMEDVSKRFGKLIGIDPWLINPLFDVLEFPRNAFDVQHVVYQLQGIANALLLQIKKRYKTYAIVAQPFVVLKTGSLGCGGTLGKLAGLLVLHQGQNLLETSTPEALQLFWQTMQTMQNPCVVVQEGVPTQESIRNASAEPVVYLFERQVVGGFYRINTDTSTTCSEGSEYITLDFANTPPENRNPNRFYMYGVLARLAMLAVSLEMENAVEFEPHLNIENKETENPNVSSASFV